MLPDCGIGLIPEAHAPTRVLTRCDRRCPCLHAVLPVTAPIDFSTQVKRYVVPDAAPGDMPVGKGAQQTMVDLRDTALATVIQVRPSALAAQASGVRVPGSCKFKTPFPAHLSSSNPARDSHLSSPSSPALDSRIRPLSQFRQMQETPALMKGKEARESLVGMLPFLEAYHPIDKCRESFGELGGLMERFWPEEEEEPAEWELFEGWEACGGEVKWEEWGSCRGSSPDQRGFSCGFWQMLHGLVLGVPDEEAQAFVQAVGEFMLHHFGCHECGEHFRRAAFSPKSGAAVASRRDLVLWMWRVHNIVNNFTAPWSDPAFPKVQWPPPSLCWQCSRDGGRPGPDGKVVWNEEQVYLFLVDFYGFIVDKDRVRHISGADGRAVSAILAARARDGRAWIRGPLGADGEGNI